LQCSLMLVSSPAVLVVVATAVIPAAVYHRG
jgi:hypothetical protein